MKLLVRGGVCIAALAVSLRQPALAQSAYGAASAPAAQSPSDDTASEGGIADIVVVAQKREERMQNVPVAVTAFSGYRWPQRVWSR
jgi:iron complex outermembrane receptor protein